MLELLVLPIGYVLLNYQGPRFKILHVMTPDKDGGNGKHAYDVGNWVYRRYLRQ